MVANPRAEGRSVGLPFLLVFLAVSDFFHLAVHIGHPVHAVDDPCANNFNSNRQENRMITEKIGKHIVERHDTAGTLPIVKYNMFNHLALYDAHVGSDMHAIKKLFHTIDGYIVNRRFDDVGQVRKNLDQTFMHLFSGNNFPALQWASLVHTFDGKEVTDQSVENLKAIIEQLSAEGLTQEKVAFDVDDAKKKFGVN
jgi:hypothetical protein